MARISYNTKQREIILSYIDENKEKHLTVDDIIEHLKKINSPVGKATVYRFMELLVNEGKVRKYTVEHGVSACYQFIDNEKCHSHYHLKCNDCGELIHIECDFFDKVDEHILKYHQFRVDNLKTVLYGTCNNCAEIGRSGDV